MGDLSELVEKMREPKPPKKQGRNFFHGFKQILITRYDVSEEQSKALAVVIISVSVVLGIILLVSLSSKVGTIVGEFMAHREFSGR